MIYLSKEQIYQIHNKQISKYSGSFGVREEPLIDSAINAPFASFDGVDLFQTDLEKNYKT